jgi:hypothetical protein
MSSLPLTKRAKLRLSQYPLRLNRWYHSRFGRAEFNPDGTGVMDEDWDTLVILDACRYDTFAALSDLPGDLERRETRGSTTDEFMRANFGTGDFRDTVYVTASPSVHVTEGVAPQFHAIVSLWNDEWDPDLRTVRPEVVTAAAIEANERHPEKRLLVHYLQPHYPFIGPTGREHFDYTAIDDPESEESELDEKFWDTVGTRINDVPERIVREAYRENLEVTLPHVRELLETVDGLTVVTADHGEMLNDRAFPIPNRLYGHPAGLYTPELVEVPWHTYRNGSRRRIVAGDRAADVDADAETVRERLQDLGYA